MEALCIPYCQFCYCNCVICRQCCPKCPLSFIKGSADLLTAGLTFLSLSLCSSLSGPCCSQGILRRAKCTCWRTDLCSYKGNPHSPTLPTVSFDSLVLCFVPGTVPLTASWGEVLGVGNSGECVRVRGWKRVHVVKWRHSRLVQRKNCLFHLLLFLWFHFWTANWGCSVLWCRGSAREITRSEKDRHTSAFRKLGKQVQKS